MKDSFHKQFYSFAKYYDIAFDFKDIPKECDFITEVTAKYSAHKPGSFIEFAAGPALHAIEFARRGFKSTAMDLSPEMTAYGLEKAQQAGVQIQYDCADMVHYQSSQKYDVAAILMDSISYLLTNDLLLQHFRSVAGILNPGGIYILEMGHPSGVFSIAKTTVNDWEMEKDNIKVKLQWGAADDVFDPITQITNTSVRLEYQHGAEHGVIEERSPQRCFTATEWDALVRASGVFEIVAWYGAMDSAVSFSNEKKSWRMVPVLRKK